MSERIKINKQKNEALVEVDTKVFAPEVIYSASYVFLDKAYFLFDGDFNSGIRITIKPKVKGTDLEKLCMEFSNELINYSVYVIQAAKKQAIREAIIRRALATNNAECAEDESDQDEEENEWVDDPEGIAKPWTPESAMGVEKPE